MKIDRYGLECVENKFLKLPNVQKYELVKRTKDGFIASVEMDDGYEFLLNARVVNQLFPSTVMQMIEKQSREQGMGILVSPYVSERTAAICEQHRLFGRTDKSSTQNSCGAGQYF